jgi:Domain of unknown function (DUF1772)
MWTQNLALLATALFTGAALYVSLVEHPARLACGPPIALAQWRPSYKRATPLQASLAVLGAFLALVAFFAGAGWAWLVAGLLIGAVVPFTLLIVYPTNRRLEENAISAAEAGPLLARWGRLHWVRTVLGATALLLMIFARG